MRVLQKLTGVFACSLVLCLCTSSRAAVMWIPPTASPAGPGLDFGYENGQSDNGLFGNPIVTATGLTFAPQGFLASATGVSSATADSKTDRLQFVLHALNGKKLNAFQVNENGDYNILGTGTVTVTGGLFLKNLDTGETRTQALTTTPVMPVSSTTSASGLWDGGELISLPGGWSNILVVLNNTVTAQAALGSHAEIQKKLVDAPSIDISFIVPEPATTGLILAAAGAGLCRRRR